MPNNLSQETLDKLRTEIAFIASAQPGHINIDSATNRIASLLTPSVEGNSVENNGPEITSNTIADIFGWLEWYKQQTGDDLVTLSVVKAVCSYGNALINSPFGVAWISGFGGEENTVDAAIDWLDEKVGSNAQLGYKPITNMPELLVEWANRVRAQSLRPGGGWTQTKPDFTEPCKLLTATWAGTDWGINAWEVMWVGEHDNTYLGLCDYYGDELGDIADLKADWYMILQPPPAARIKTGLKPI